MESVLSLLEEARRARVEPSVLNYPVMVTQDNGYSVPHYALVFEFFEEVRPQLLAGRLPPHIPQVNVKR